MENVRKYMGAKAAKVQFCKSVEEATKGADAVAVVTEWNEFITQDWTKIAALMRGKHVFDGRNCLASGKVAAAGLYYRAVGRPEVKPGQGRQGRWAWCRQDNNGRLCMSMDSIAVAECPSNGRGGLYWLAPDAGVGALGGACAGDG